MSVAETVEKLGGFATRRQLRARHTRKEMRVALAHKLIVRTGRGRYAVPQIATDAALAHKYCAVRSHLSAALAHGWAVKTPPAKPWLLLTEGRRIPDGLRKAAYVSRAALTTHERRGGVTAPLRTVLDCARALPFDEALAVADSALRSGKVDSDHLRDAGRRARGPGAGKIRRVAQAADGRAANPFESVLRAIVLDIPGLDVRPQQGIAEPGLYARVDLLDRARRLVLEAEGFEHHGTKQGFIRDVRRYSEMGMYGWRVLRFVWVDVMHHQVWVRWVIETWLATEDGTALPLIPDDSPYIDDRAG